MFETNIIKKERAWAEINLDNIIFNYHQIKKITQKNVMAILKADAYGHGDVHVAETLFKEGVKYFGTATYEEASNIKNHLLSCIKNNSFSINKDVSGKFSEADLKKYITQDKFDMASENVYNEISLPEILILGFTPEDKLTYVVENDLQQTVFDSATAQRLSYIASKLNKQAKIHIKIDTGMHRLGFSPTPESIETINKINNLPGISIVGIFSHFAQSDVNDDEFTLEQYKKFKYVLDNLKHIEMLRHIQNSAGIVNYPHIESDLVRSGLLLYGLSPSKKIKMDLKPAMSLKSQVISIKEINTGESISYNRKFFADRKMKIGIIPIGYADGYPHLASNCAKTIVNGKFAPIVGNVCMDYSMIDITGTNTKIGDEVTLIGSDENSDLNISANDIAKISHTISYEMITSIGKRIPRYYIKG